MNFGLKYEFFRNFVFNKARAQVMKMSGGLYPAPLKVFIHLFIVYIIEVLLNSSVENFLLLRL